jgi:inward rectifier potassium channel
MPLSWTIAHFINVDSPFHKLTEEAFRSGGGEILVQIRAIDQVSSQAIRARASYAAEDIAWNSRYAGVYLHDSQTGLLKVDLKKFDSVVPL